MPLKIHSQDTLDRARHLRESGASLSETGRAVGVAPIQVKRWEQRGWRPRKLWTPDDDRKLCAWRGPYTSFARQHGWGVMTIYRALRRMGMRYTPPVSVDELELAVQTGAWNIGRRKQPLRRISALRGRIRDVREGWVFTTVGVARLMGGGMTYRIVRRWINHGLLTATRTGRTKTSWYLITHDALLDALRNPLTWPDWRVDAITDPDWQAVAAEIREESSCH